MKYIDVQKILSNKVARMGTFFRVFSWYYERVSGQCEVLFRISVNLDQKRKGVKCLNTCKGEY